MHGCGAVAMTGARVASSSGFEGFRLRCYVVLGRVGWCEMLIVWCGPAECTPTLPCRTVHLDCRTG